LYHAHVGMWTASTRTAPRSIAWTDPFREEVGDEERLRRARSGILPKAVFFALSPQQAAMPSKIGGVPRASSNHKYFLPGIGRQGAQRFLSSVLKNEGNRLAQIREAFFTGCTAGQRTRVGGSALRCSLGTTRRTRSHLFRPPARNFRAIRFSARVSLRLRMPLWRRPPTDCPSRRPANTPPGSHWMQPTETP
jgi:hypothetical protein